MVLKSNLRPADKCSFLTLMAEVNLSVHIFPSWVWPEVQQPGVKFRFNE